jgi:hypothetical protein
MSPSGSGPFARRGRQVSNSVFLEPAVDGDRKTAEFHAPWAPRAAPWPAAAPKRLQKGPNGKDQEKALMFAGITPSPQGSPCDERSRKRP